MGMPFQKTPLKSKLSYLWAQAVNEDRIYSHVFHDAKREAVMAEPGWGKGVAFHQIAHHFHWLEAKPFNGQRDQFVIKAFSYKRNGMSMVTDDRKVTESVLSLEQNGRSVFTRAEAESVIRQYEQKYASEGKVPLRNQPFDAFVKTSLTPGTQLA